MKRLLILSITFLLASCTGILPTSSSQENTSTEPTSNTSSLDNASEESTNIDTSEELTSEDTSSEETYSFENSSEDPVEEGVYSIQDSAILHTWDWSISRIINSLDDIEQANFRAIQLSPLQPTKNPSANAEWWHIYQPLGFKVATGDENPLGTKQELTDLCRKAEEKGIKIVMDVVTNHLAQGNNTELFVNAQPWSGQRSVRTFESKIADDNLIHGNFYADDDGSLLKVVRGSLGGLPDLQTENEYVQERIISMLKEYIDCGVKGFRFDAAKHIETPDDGDYASNYWPNVINAINEHGKQVYDEEPYVYGEILNTPGSGRSWGSYTKYMSLVDNRQAETILYGVKDGDAGRASSSYYNIGSSSKAVLWAESHDTYANKNAPTPNIDTRVINLTYAIQASRKGAATLYFARPDHYYGEDKTPQVVPLGNDDYKSPLVSAANKFHNDFIEGSEKLSSTNSIVLNYREEKNGNNEGLLIADTRLSSRASFNFDSLSDGQYTDTITGKTYDVTNGAIDVELTDGACILEKNATGVTGPRISIRTQDNKTTFASSLSVRIDVVDGVESSYTINGKNKTTFNQSTTFTIDSSYPDGKYLIEVTAKNADDVTRVKKITVTKNYLAAKAVVLENVPSNANILAWIWKDNGNGHWIDMDVNGTTYSLEYEDLTNGENWIIFVLFPDGIDSTTADWNIKIAQTGNLSISTQFFDLEKL